MRDCHSIVGLYTYQNRVPFAPSLRWVSCKERDRLPHEGANFHSSFVHYPLSTYCHKHVLASRYYPYNERHESTANKSRAQSKNSTSKREYDIPRACKTF